MNILYINETVYSFVDYPHAETESLVQVNLTFNNTGN